MRLGIFGGTFNPIHQGHLALIDLALERLSLDELLLIPTAMPPHKDFSDLQQAQHRLNMCRIAVAQRRGVRVCDLEVLRGGRSYTVDTLRLLKVQRPGDELFLLMGSDMFYTILEWHCADEVLRLAKIVAVARQTGEKKRLEEHCARLEALGVSAQVLYARPTVASSTEIREGEGDALPDAVEDYILQNGLYGRGMKIPVDLDVLTARLRATLSRERFVHTLNVASEAIRLSRRWGADAHLAYLSGLLHDICKELPQQDMLNLLADSAILTDKTFLASPKIWHGFAASIYIARELSIRNTQIIEAVRYHSTGRAGMSLLEKILYMADLISADRSYSGVEQLRAKAYRSLDEAVFEALGFMVGDLARAGRPIWKDTLDAYNLYAQDFHAQKG
jgi:nicotinate-nucleotide adenylyltransferase